MASLDGDNLRVGSFISPESCKRDELNGVVETYIGLFDAKSASPDERRGSYMRMVNSFYDLVTNFYEFGWGQSFHFAPRHQWESFDASIARHEMWLAHRLELNAGKKVLDVGCGVGGPARCIARFSEATVVGLNNNAYQLERARMHTRVQGLDDKITYVKGDFMNIPEKDNSFDAVYAIEATVHAPNKDGVYSQMFRVLKPGGLLGLYEWCMTPRYDSSNPRHRRIKSGIERGNSIPELEPIEHILACVRRAGFEILESRDIAESPLGDHHATSWFHSLSGSWTLSGFKHTPLGRYLTNRMVAILEGVWLAPKGTTEVSNFLMATADDLVESGRLGIFTPMWFILARKPNDAAATSTPAAASSS